MHRTMTHLHRTAGNSGTSNNVDWIILVEVTNSARSVKWLSVGVWKTPGNVSEEVEALIVVLGRQVLNEEVFEVLSVESKVKCKPTAS